MSKKSLAIRNIAVSNRVHRTIRTLAFQKDIKMYQALELIIAGKVSARKIYRGFKNG